ncbi:MAG: 4-hydroxythreonine-4-phosphate dehydrogenase PdxA, partial [Pseudomonadota bacterium]
MPGPIALTCGEPSGIGPELAVSAWRSLKDRMAFFWIGDPSHLPDGAQIVEIEGPAEARDAMAQGLPVIRHGFDGALTRGHPNPDHAPAVIEVIARAVAWAKSGQASALCTSPIHKKALQDGAGFPYPGHTEYLAALAEVDDVVMMLASEQLRVVPATIHIPLQEVPSALTPQTLETTIRITQAALMRDFGLPSPRLAVAGLNPHAGEGGNMGTEEVSWIGPLLETLREQGFDVKGPMSADTMFHAEAREGYDAAIAMYHDQALIPIKTLYFDRGVNLTLGL